MFCVIQEIERKSPDRRGFPKELISMYTRSSFLGNYFSHYYGEDRFERPIRKAYKISIHESYRENGKVKKRQFSICTVGYYDLAEGCFTLYDWSCGRIEKAAKQLNVNEDVLYKMIEEKIGPLEDQIRAEFEQTEEFRVHAEHEQITTIYAARKAEFNQEYGTIRREYDSCYDVFGNLVYPENLEKIKAERESQKEYERRSEEESRRYYDKFHNNYKSGGYSDLFSNNYAVKDPEILKQFYRTLSKIFHPDSNHGKDTSEEMKVLNQLKQEWGV